MQDNIFNNKNTQNGWNKKMMKKREEEQIQEYMRKLEIRNPNKKETLKRIIREEKRTIFHIIDNILFIIAITLIIIAQVNGYFERDNITIDCNQEIQEINGQKWTINQTLEEYQNEQGRTIIGTKQPRQTT